MNSVKPTRYQHFEHRFPTKYEGWRNCATCILHYGFISVLVRRMRVSASVAVTK
jgi:hypothetical protein